MNEPSKENMVKKSVMVSRDQDEYLKTRSRITGQSQGEIIRNLIELRRDPEKLLNKATGNDSDE